jgi:DNA-directed RNA polymerase specialized sigma24 family protein
MRMMSRLRHITSWIYQIARNAIVDYYRTQRPTIAVPKTLVAPDGMLSDDAVQELLPCVTAPNQVSVALYCH